MKKLLAILMCLFSFNSFAQERITLGVYMYLPKDIMETNYRGLGEYISKQTGYPVDVKIMTYDEISEEITHNHIDFAITNPVHYLILKSKNSMITSMATVVMEHEGLTTKSLGGTILVDRDNPEINKIEDLSGKTVAVSKSKFLGGYLAPLQELKNKNINVNLVETDSHEQAIQFLLSGKASAAFVRTGVLESLIKSQRLPTREVKVINRQKIPDFPFAVSTQLYPEYPFVRMPHVNDETARKVMAAIFSIEKGNPAVKSIGMAGFSTTADYQSVETLMKNLNVFPFDSTQEMDWSHLWKEYPTEISGGTFLLLLAFIALGMFLNGKRKIVQASTKAKNIQKTLHVIMNNTPFLILRRDSSGKILYANRAFCQATSTSENFLIGNRLSDIPNMHPLNNLQPGVKSQIVKVEFADESEHMLEVTIITKTDDSDYDGDIMICSDVTERESARKAIIESEEKLLFTLEKAPNVGVQWYDIDGRIIYWNSASENIFGWGSMEVVGESTETCIHSEEEARLFRQKLREIAKAQRVIGPFESKTRNKNGQEISVESTMFVLPKDALSPFVFAKMDINVTDRETALANLRSEHSFFNSLIQSIPDMVWTKDIEGRHVLCNTAAETFLGKTKNEIFGKTDYDIFEVSYAEEARKNELIAEVSGHLRIFEERLVKDGKEIFLETSRTPLNDEAGNLQGVICISRDITERRKSEERLKLAAGVFTHAREGITITDPSGNILEVNDAFIRITGYKREEVVGKNPRILKSGRQGDQFYRDMWVKIRENGHWHGEVWNRRKNGEVYAELLTISSIKAENGEVLRYVAIFSDITLIKEQQQQLERIAHYDALTNLPNRVLLHDRLRHAIANSKRQGTKIAVAYLDLDGFKEVNDTYGHDAGDTLLITVAGRMNECLRETDTIARLGGDEFVAVLTDFHDINACLAIMERLLVAAATPIHTTEDITLHVSGSLGVTFYPQSDDIDPDQLLRQADQAMYQAKLAGKNRFHIFDAEHDRNIRGHHESIERIRQALENKEFVLYYQPKVNMREGRVIGAEALIRWIHPERGLVPPLDFLPIIETTLLGVEVGDWVMEDAIRQVSEWPQQGFRIPVSVNITVMQMQQPDFVQKAVAAFNKYPEVPRDMVEFEILETGAIDDISKVSDVMREANSLGIGFALDDFGTGYSSLTYLKKLPAHTIKIDQSFVRGMLKDVNDQSILEGVLGLATAFNLQAIAEGVETKEHGDMLLKLGCELAQGYSIAKPMPVKDLERWMTEWKPFDSWIRMQRETGVNPQTLFAGIEHKAWVSLVKECITHHHLPKNECRFGKWLCGEGQRLHGDHPDFAEIENLHAEIHSMPENEDGKRLSADSADVLLARLMRLIDDERWASPLHDDEHN